MVFAALALAAHSPLLAQSDVPDKQLRSISAPSTAPDFRLLDMESRPHTLSDFEDRVILVNFWATWCPPCRKEMPALERLSRRLGAETFEVVAINVAEGPERAGRFLDSLPEQPTFTVLLDPDGKVARDWGVKVLPTTWVVDRETRRILGAVGEVDFDSAALREQLQGLITGHPVADATEGR
jgi:thiol-disulfide isomerase/thioredoxin